MSDIVQLTYSSVATNSFDRDELSQLLAHSRKHNHEMGVTGMLLYAEGSFFQVLEGEPGVVDTLFASITRDPRHRQVTEIIKEPIAKRDFGDWTMGYTEFTTEDVAAILGANDFFINGSSFANLQHSRARKLLQAFKDGRWRTRLNDTAPTMGNVTVTAPDTVNTRKAITPTYPMPAREHYSFAFQPIIDTSSQSVFSYEALIRGINNESAGEVLGQIPDDEMHRFDEQCRLNAIKMAAHLGLHTRLNLNFLPRSIETSPTVITSLLEVVSNSGIKPEQIVIEILEREIISDYEHFIRVLNECRGAGVIFAIDDFGSGYAGLNMLAEFQPNLIKLDMQLIRGIHHKGPRQAIVRGILRTCNDLGIEILAEGVEEIEEYQWLHNEGIHLYQGNLFATPAFESLKTSFFMPQ